jgi:hypothetical protein
MRLQPAQESPISMVHPPRIVTPRTGFACSPLAWKIVRRVTELVGCTIWIIGCA